MTKYLAAFAAFFLSLGSTCAFAADAPHAYRVTRRVKLGGEGFWDYLTVDHAGHRIFITRQSHVMVVDSETLKVTADVPDTPGAHGVALAPQLKKAFITAGGDSTLVVLDLDSAKATNKVKVGNTPDAVLYDEFSGRVFTFNALGHDATAVEGGTEKVAGLVALGGKPEFAVTDGKGKIFVNIEDKGEIVSFDAKSLKVLNRWSMAGCEEPSALAFDREHHRLFSGCGNRKATVLDSESGRVVTAIPIGEGVDAAAFDAGQQAVFFSTGDGHLNIVHEDSPDRYSVLQNVETARGARTMAMDPETHTIYTVTAEVKSEPPAVAGARPKRTMTPGSFELLVVTQQ